MQQRSYVPPTPPPPAAAAPAQAPQAAAAHPSSQGGGDGNVKETIESILVAFILAFIFRAFVVEAFVIPTGSMAPTLLGAHVRFDCDDCGYDFELNYSPPHAPAGAEADDINIPPTAGPIVRSRQETVRGRTTTRYWSEDKIYRAACPNCGYQMPLAQAKNPRVHYGDRILVLKYLYLFDDPERWDVVVFKSPYQPELYKYQQNYIKRLVGKPGESVLILDGDIYKADDALAAGAIQNYQVQTKPRHVQEALWRVIYDNDYHPRELKRVGGTWEQPWTPVDGSGWTVDPAGGAGAAGRAFTFDNAAGAGTIRFDATKNPSKHAFTDWLAYDVEKHQEAGQALRNVSDLRLRFFYARGGGDGPLRLRMTKRGDAFVAELTATEAKLFRVAADGSRAQLGQTAAVSLGGAPTEVELTNVDYQVTLRVGGKDVIRTTPQEYAPDTAALLAEVAESAPVPEVAITAERQQATVNHVGLWRDIYYLNRDGGAAFWAGPQDFPRNVIHLGADEYFVLGDNSLLSGDARYWQDPIDIPSEHLDVQSGRVPGRFLLGKAFFVYWPAGFRPADSLPAVVPNFGDMRFIR